MKSETRNILLKAYAELHKIIEELYEAHDRAILVCMQYILTSLPFLSPKRREALNLTPLSLEGKGLFLLGLYSMQLRTAIEQ
ncbi:hypothetical protein [Nostoc sp.]|uniref:hypothetical protein n=1 Tax=Nostoc sp. TaxID=1180 RepID=UPI002FF7668A